MNKTIAILFLCICCLNCKRENAKHNKNFDTSKITHPQTVNDTMDGKQYIAILQTENRGTTVNLSQSELKLIDNLLRKSVDDYNSERENKIDLRYYKRQYFPQIYKGHKVVGVFCFCEIQKNNDWKNKPVNNPEDGGNCFLHTMINLSNKTTDFFQTNSHS